VLTATPPAAAAQDNPWSAWLQEFPELAGEMSTDKQPSLGVQHSIKTVGCPVTAKFCRLDPERLAAAKAEFNSMLKAGIIRRSSSQWASPLHLVRKKDGSWRPCGDFRRLNLITTTDKYPLPNMADFAARLDGCRVFSKLDLNKGYLQVPVAAADIPKTALITPFGLFEFVRMPFGLKNAGMTFQLMMDAIFADLPSCSSTSMTSSSPAEL
jgi:Reverse transcriptase (RNA-dependent DNA polymerase)